jgi:hypothetical protein
VENAANWPLNDAQNAEMPGIVHVIVSFVSGKNTKQCVRCLL